MFNQMEVKLVNIYFEVYQNLYILFNGFRKIF